jgi:hypothetical protein
MSAVASTDLTTQLFDAMAADCQTYITTKRLAGILGVKRPVVNSILHKNPDKVTCYVRNPSNSRRKRPIWRLGSPVDAIAQVEEVEEEVVVAEEISEATLPSEASLLEP